MCTEREKLEHIQTTEPWVQVGLQLTAAVLGLLVFILVYWHRTSHSLQNTHRYFWKFLDYCVLFSNSSLADRRHSLLSPAPDGRTCMGVSCGMTELAFLSLLCVFPSISKSLKQGGFCVFPNRVPNF